MLREVGFCDLPDAEDEKEEGEDRKRVLNSGRVLMYERRVEDG